MGVIQRSWVGGCVGARRAGGGGREGEGRCWTSRRDVVVSFSVKLGCRIASVFWGEGILRVDSLEYDVHC